MPELTDANMTVWNDNPNPIIITVTNNTKMKGEFPSPATIPSGVSSTATVTASSWPGQSSFNVNFASGETAHVLLGTGIYSTSCTPQTFPDGKSAALLAPGPPLTAGVDYHFWFFNGPGLLQSLANSVLQANLPALIAYVNQNPVKIPVNDSVSFNVTGINADPQTLQCVYASTLPMLANSNWYMNVILNLGQATVNGSMTIDGKTGDFDLTMSNVMIWVQVEIDPTLQTMPKVLELQMSLGDYSGGGTILSILEALFPFIAMLVRLGATPHRVAGAINNQLNVKIINGINSALGKLRGSSTSSAAEDQTNGVHEPQHHATHLLVNPRLPGVRLSPGPAIGNLSTWMSNTHIQSLQLEKLRLPGTHDSGTYQLSATLSQISYKGIKVLWDISPGTAPANGQNPIIIPPTTTNQAYIGQPLYDWVMGVGVNSISRTQNLTILEQLQAGIRYLDFRVYYDTRENDFYLQHALRGPKFSDVLMQMQTFLTANSTATELIFAFVSHTNFADQPSYRQDFTTLINSIIPANNIYYQPVPSGQTQFDFQTLASETVSSITNGASKIMFINGDGTNYAYDNTVTNTNGFSGVGWHGNEYTVQQISDQQGPPMAKPHDPLWAVSWSLDTDLRTAVENILTNLTGVSVWALQGVATTANAALWAFFQQYGTAFNVLTADWPEYGGSTSVPEMIIQMNWPLPS